MKPQFHLIRGYDPNKSHLFAAVKKKRAEFHATPEYQELMKSLEGEPSSVKLRAAHVLGYQMGVYKSLPRF